MMTGVIFFIKMQCTGIRALFNLVPECIQGQKLAWFIIGKVIRPVALPKSANTRDIKAAHFRRRVLVWQDNTANTNSSTTSILWSRLKRSVQTVISVYTKTTKTSQACWESLKTYKTQGTTKHYKCILSVSMWSQ